MLVFSTKAHKCSLGLHTEITWDPESTGLGYSLGTGTLSFLSDSSVQPT